MKVCFRILIFNLFGLILIENISAMLAINPQRQNQISSSADFMLRNLSELNSEEYCKDMDGQFRSNLFKELLNQSILHWPNAAWWSVCNVIREDGLKWPYYSISLSGNGCFFVSASVDGTVKIFEKLHKSGWICVFELIKDAWSVALSDNGNVLVLGTFCGSVEIYQKSDAGVFERIELFESNSGGHFSVVNYVAISADGHVILSGSRDNKLNVYKKTYRKNFKNRWELADVIDCQCIGDDGMSSLALSSNGKCLAFSTWGGDIVIYRRLARGNWKHVRRFYGEGYGDAVSVSSLAMNEEGTFLVAGLDDASIRIYQMGDRNDWVLANIFLNDDASRNVAVNSVAVSANESVIISGSDDGSVKFYRKNMRNEWTLVKVFNESNGGHSGPVYTVSLSGDGAVVASGSGDGIIKIYSTHKFKGIEKLLSFVKQVAK